MNLGHGLDISRDGTGCYTESMIPSWVESGAIPNWGSRERSVPREEGWSSVWGLVSMRR